MSRRHMVLPGHSLFPKRRRIRKVVPTKYEPKPDTHRVEVHHIRFQRHGGSDKEHNLVALTPAQHRALHAVSDRRLRSHNGKKVMGRKGYASNLAKRRQLIHRTAVGETKYRSYMSNLARKRWSAYRQNGRGTKARIKKAA